MVGTERTFKRAGSIAKFTKPVCDEPQVLSLFRGRAEFWNGNSKIYYIVTRFNRSAAKPTKRMGSEVSSRPPSNNLRVESRVAGPGFWDRGACRKSDIPERTGDECPCDRNPQRRQKSFHNCREPGTSRSVCP